MVGSLTWLSHQNCNDMFIYAKWNSSTTYGFGNNDRDFGTDYGICCWYTPQLNFSAIPDGKQFSSFSKPPQIPLTLLFSKFLVRLGKFSIGRQTLWIRKKTLEKISALNSLFWASSKLPCPTLIYQINVPVQLTNFEHFWEKLIENYLD